MSFKSVRKYLFPFQCVVFNADFKSVSYGTKKPVHDVRTIAEVEGGVVKPGRDVEWKEQIIVPPLPQSCLAGCELIKIEYYVKVRSPLLLSSCSLMAAKC